jgi:hypothetical protein
VERALSTLTCRTVMCLVCTTVPNLSYNHSFGSRRERFDDAEEQVILPWIRCPLLTFVQSAASNTSLTCSCVKVGTSLHTFVLAGLMTDEQHFRSLGLLMDAHQRRKNLMVVFSIAWAWKSLEDHRNLRLQGNRCTNDSVSKTTIWYGAAKMW